MPSGDYHTDKHVFRHHLTPESDEGLDVGQVDRRFAVMRAREVQVDTLTAGVVISATPDTAIPFGNAGGTLSTDVTNLNFNDGTNTLRAQNADVGTLTLDTALAVAEGGTGATTAAGARTNLDAAQTAHTHAAADIASGTIATARLGSGTADATSYLRGDQTWAQLLGLPTVVGFNGRNSGANAYILNANYVLLRNPSNNGIHLAVATGDLTNTLTTAGPAANGRDQAGVFASGSTVHFYFIWNGTTLATLSSATGPTTGPTMPTGYTHWAYATSLILTAENGPISSKAMGSWLYLLNQGGVLSAGAATVETSISLSSFVPVIARAVQVNWIFRITAAATTSHADTAEFRHTAGSAAFFQLNVHHFTSVSDRNAGACVLPLPTAQTIYYIHDGHGGNGGTSVIDVNVMSYQVPNGGE